ncbi:AAA family ATPase [Clostridium algidicarnis]|uniref:AAA family ATPase n=1 Tax=Clostridium algidicarnis TaxID=37659 RepID=UPI00162636B9|nr:AAA family ATPase [Clostridium algidicarnis]MBB6698478.1 AAA family ATPase [Clostridium algidicarnis]
MIKNIKISNCCPYDESGVEIMDCKKVNFFYGANGSGKTTISEFLRKQGSTSERYSCSEIEWESEESLPIYVYNRQFRELNFNQEDGIPGVFTLGQDAIDDRKAIELLKKDLEEKNNFLNKIKASIEEKRKERENKELKFKENAWNQILKKHEESFEKAFEGFRSNKNKFIEELIKRISDPQGSVEDKEKLLERANSLFNRKPLKMNLLNIPSEDEIESIFKIHNDDIWQQVISGSKDVGISKLINELNNSSWLHQGIKYLNKSDNICPFCQKETINSDFKEQLELFFDTKYTQSIDNMKSKLQELNGLVGSIITRLKENIEKTDEVKIGQLNIEIYDTLLSELETRLENANNKINEKIRSPEIKISWKSLGDLVNEFKSLLLEANEKINNNNRLVLKFAEEQKQLIDDVWLYCINESDSLIESYEKSMDGINKALNSMDESKKNAESKIKELDNEIKERSENLSSIQPTVDQINNMLKSYGFNSFHIEPYEDEDTEQLNKYRIMRDDGSIAANNLSEGESTFLIFLYFMQLTKGSINKDEIHKKKILVIDDPISSLDSNVLYLVSAMVKDLIRKIKNNQSDVHQLFLFTHNVYFHKEVSFIDGRTKESGDVNYWIIRKNEGISRIHEYGMKNPITTTYELLWKELREDGNISFTSIQNTMRRILENYFSMLGNKRDEHLISKFDTQEEKIICKSLLHWINDGSHDIYDDIHVDQYTDISNNYHRTFKEIFIKAGHEAHYNMMMKIDDRVKEYDIVTSRATSES